MTRRRLLCGLLLLSSVLACVAGWLVIASGPRVTWERFEQVKRGMTEEEVIRILGGPPSMMEMRSPGGDGTRDAVWRGDDDSVLIVRFESDRVADFWLSEVTPPTFTERIRRWLGL
jgi:hypothetical protein